MKSLLILCVSMAASLAQAAITTTGTCQLEQSQETFTLQNVDPVQHYGLFAQGFSSRNDRVYLTENFQNAIDINIQTVDGSGYSIIPIGPGGVTIVKFGVFLIPHQSGGQAQWLSCDLTVKM